MEHLKEVSDLVTDLVTQNLPVHTAEVPLADSKDIPALRMLDGEVLTYYLCVITNYYFY